MRGLFLCGFFLLFAVGARSAQLPLTVKEVSLMLRAGYSSGSVVEELSKRHFADTVDAAKESALVKAGATPALLGALKSGAYAVSSNETAHVQEQIARQSLQSEMQIERSQKADAAFQAKVARDRKTTALQSAAGNVIYDAVKGDLVRWNNGTVAPMEDQALANKKLIALYFSGHWCPPCRKFTPELVQYYNRVAPQHPEFELIFVSCDKSLFAMQTYMRETNMPWPAIDYQKVKGKDFINGYGGKAVPCLVLVDSAGKIVSDSFAGTEYVGPQKVLADLDAIFARNAAGQVAQGR
jgi:nucleoredoxin